MILVTLVSSGLATATNTVRWCMILLAARPELQERAYNAIRRVYPTDSEAFDSVMKDEEEVAYISALVKETLRYGNGRFRRMSTTTNVTVAVCILLPASPSPGLASRNLRIKENSCHPTS